MGKHLVGGRGCVWDLSQNDVTYHHGVLYLCMNSVSMKKLCFEKYYCW